MLHMTFLFVVYAIFNSAYSRTFYGQGVALAGSQLSSANGCSCESNKCVCCVIMDVPKIHLNETGCVVVKYLDEEAGVDMEFTVNNVVIIEEKVSLRNPPPLCEELPHLGKYASLCVHLYNITWIQKYGGCVKVEAKLMHVTLKEMELGCFYFYEKPNPTVVSQIYNLFHNFMSVTKRVYKEENRVIKPLIL